MSEAEPLFTSAQVASWREVYNLTVRRAERLFELIRAAEQLDPITTDCDYLIPFGSGSTTRHVMPALNDAPAKEGGALVLDVPAFLGTMKKGASAKASRKAGRPAGKVFWTPERNKRLLDGVASGESYQVISEAIGAGCTKRAVEAQRGKIKKRLASLTSVTVVLPSSAAATDLGEESREKDPKSVVPAKEGRVSPPASSPFLKDAEVVRIGVVVQWLRDFTGTAIAVGSKSGCWNVGAPGPKCRLNQTAEEIVRHANPIRRTSFLPPFALEKAAG